MSEKIQEVQGQGIESIETQKLEWGPELGQMSWDKAIKEIEQLNNNLKDGEKPWRLPTTKELLDESKKNVLNRTSFLGDNYWSADIPGRSKDYACFVTFFESTDSCDEKKYTDYYVRCVR